MIILFNYYVFICLFVYLFGINGCLAYKGILVILRLRVFWLFDEQG